MNFGYQGGGRSNGRNSGRFNPGRGRGRSNFQNNNHNTNINNNQSQGEKPVHDWCRFFAQGQCTKANCQFVHAVGTLKTKAHDKAINSIAFHSPTTSLISGSSGENALKIWSLPNSLTLASTIPTTPGKITCIVTSDSNNILYAVDEPLYPEAPEITTGVALLFNGQQHIRLQKSDEVPFTHASGDIRKIIMTTIDNINFIITAGADCLIKVWKLDSTLNKFELLTSFEGHVRAITSILMIDSFIWSASQDCTIKVWENSGKCLATFTPANQGHTAAITALVHIPSVPARAESYVASGSVDHNLKLWKASGGELTATFPHIAPISALSVFQDTHGGVQTLLVGLANGSICVRSCLSMTFLALIDSAFCQTGPIYSITPIGNSCFATGGEDGQIIVWIVQNAITDPNSQSS